jgi:hypothetical protein
MRIVRQQLHQPVEAFTPSNQVLFMYGSANGHKWTGTPDKTWFKWYDLIGLG